VGVLDQKQAAMFTMAVFDEHHGVQAVFIKPSSDECKESFDDLCTTWINRARQVGEGSKQALVFMKWHFTISHDGKIVEEGPVSWLPTKRGGW
jgi:hypothetical protein